MVIYGRFYSSLREHVWGTDSTQKWTLFKVLTKKQNSLVKDCIKESIKIPSLTLNEGQIYDVCT